MRMQIRAGTIALALLGSASLALAQTSSGGSQEKLNLSQQQERAVSQGLRNEQAQNGQGYQGQVGSTPPASLQQKQLPSNVTDQVPATKTYLFIKLPDRILLIDPDSKAVAEIVGPEGTTGGPAAAPSGSSPKQ
jgi:type II secretory pathway pseudopilin PulG